MYLSDPIWNRDGVLHWTIGKTFSWSGNEFFNDVRSGKRPRGFKTREEQLVAGSSRCNTHDGQVRSRRSGSGGDVDEGEREKRERRLRERERAGNEGETYRDRIDIQWLAAFYVLQGGSYIYNDDHRRKSSGECHRQRKENKITGVRE
jgi:hypothetical protein